MMTAISWRKVITQQVRGFREELNSSYELQEGAVVLLCMGLFSMFAKDAPSGVGQNTADLVNPSL